MTAASSTGQPSWPADNARVPGLVSESTRSETVRTGHCLCLRIAYRVVGDPIDPHLCSCEHETRISGAPAVLWVGFRRESLTWTGPGREPKWHSTYPTLHRGFCAECSSTIASVDDTAPHLIAVNGFSLNDRSGTDPVGHSYRHEAAPWMTISLAPDLLLHRPSQ
ncbi:GFA family protein [Streptomyces sp. NRRL B-24572]|uniref:GFA family protein n=1 Tax=Streptomyces sp. NRRL B-24572 TaxID=1962156 RepID=UPI000A384CFE|nr:GFA family protein [Streptomyces sp. NRRL B-24572]